MGADFRRNDFITKALSVLVSAVIIIAITIAAIAIVLAIGLPALDRAREAMLISEAKDIMQAVDNAIREVIFEGQGSQRLIQIVSSGGDYFVEAAKDQIVFKLTSISGVISPGTYKKEGNLLITAGTDVKAYEGPTWWNSDYQYRQQINITNNANSALEQNYTVNITFNHSQLVQTGKSLASGNDARIIYWDGVSNREIDRINTTMFNNATNFTVVWFRLQQNVSANQSDTNYFLYYGNPSAGAAPANGSRVYVFYDGFDAVPTTWTSPYAESGSVTLSQPSAGIVRVTGTSGIRDTATPAFSSITQFVTETKVVDIQDPGDEEPAYFIFYNSASTYVKWGRYQSSGEGRILPTNAGTGSQKSSTYYGSGDTLKVIYNGSAYLFYINNILVSTETGITLIGITRVGLGGYDFDTGWYNDWDYLMVRKYLSPEPSAALGAEETVNKPEMSYLILENPRIFFVIRKIGNSSVLSTVNTSKLIQLISVKETGLNITPADSSVTIEGDASSRNGTGYTELTSTGELLREASVKALVNSTAARVSYEIWYTLRSNADFILQEIKNIVYW